MIPALSRHYKLTTKQGKRSILHMHSNGTGCIYEKNHLTAIDIGTGEQLWQMDEEPEIHADPGCEGRCHPSTGLRSRRSRPLPAETEGLDINGIPLSEKLRSCSFAVQRMGRSFTAERQTCSRINQDMSMWKMHYSRGLEIRCSSLKIPMGRRGRSGKPHRGR